MKSTRKCLSLAPPLVWEQVFTEEGEAVLTAKATLPDCSGSDPAARRFRDYYARLLAAFQKSTQKLAQEQAQRRNEARLHSRWFEPAEVTLAAQWKLEEGGLLRVDWRAEGLGRMLTDSDLWELRSGWLCCPKERHYAQSD